MERKLLKITAYLLILLVALASSCQPEEPKEIEYTISHTSLNFNATGGENEFTVSIKSPAIVESIESLSAWCQVSTTGVSPVNVIVTVDPYTYYEARNTTVVVHMKLGENKTSVAVPITQAGVEIPEWVLIDGIKWATRNVDAPGTFAAKPEDPGMFYQWSSKVGWSATDPMISSDGDTTWINYVAGSGSSPWEKVHDPCPLGWRMPTRNEMQTLQNADSQWTTRNGVNGRVIGSDSDLLFLPAAGMRYFQSGRLLGVGVYGCYWHSTSNFDYLRVEHDFLAIIHPSFSSVYSVRCVAE